MYKTEKFQDISNTINNVNTNTISSESALDVLHSIPKTLQEINDYTNERVTSENVLGDLYQEATKVEESRIYTIDDAEDVQYSYALTLLGPVIAASLAYVSNGIFLAIVGAFLGVIAGSYFDDVRHRSAQNEARENKKLQRSISRDKRFNRTQDAQTIDVVRAENDRIKVELSTFHSALEDSLKNRAKALSEAAQNIIEFLHTDVNIETNIIDPTTKGKPVINWETPNLSNDKGYEALTKFNEHGLVSQFFIYRNSGARITKDYAGNCVCVYSGSSAKMGQFVDHEAPENQSIHYYAVVEILRLGYNNQSGEWKQYKIKTEFEYFSETLRVSNYVSDEEALEAEIRDHTTKAKRAKFHEKIGKTSGAGDTDPAEVQARIAKERLEAFAKKKKSEEGIKELQATLSAAGLPEEEIEEAIEEYLQSI